jgi:hypothetical protein
MMHKVALPVLAVVVTALAACTHSANYDARTAYGCTGPDAAETCKYPTYAQAVIIDGAPYEFLPYRDLPEGREFYFHGMWRKADPGQPYGRS